MTAVSDSFPDIGLPLISEGIGEDVGGRIMKGMREFVRKGTQEDQEEPRETKEAVFPRAFDPHLSHGKDA